MSSIPQTMRYGIAAIAVRPADRPAFDALEASLRREIAPEQALEEILFIQVLQAAWTLQRCRSAQAQLEAESWDAGFDPLLNPALDPALRRIALRAAAAERRFFAALHEIRARQTEMYYRYATRESEGDGTGLGLATTRAVDAALSSRQRRGTTQNTQALLNLLNSPLPSLIPAGEA